MRPEISTTSPNKVTVCWTQLTVDNAEHQIILTWRWWEEKGKVTVNGGGSQSRVIVSARTMHLYGTFTALLGGMTHRGQLPIGWQVPDRKDRRSRRRGGRAVSTQMLGRRPSSLAAIG
jgi:hypothetical protein